jgi:hypothetical protein
MGFGVLRTDSRHNSCHPRGDLVGDLVLSDMDSVQDTYGMTNIKIDHIPYQQAATLLEQTLK